jgi:hypothetical protein
MQALVMMSIRGWRSETWVMDRAWITKTAQCLAVVAADELIRYALDGLFELQ